MIGGFVRLARGVGVGTGGVGTPGVGPSGVGPPVLPAEGPVVGATDGSGAADGVGLGVTFGLLKRANDLSKPIALVTATMNCFQIGPG